MFTDETGEFSWKAFFQTVAIVAVVVALVAVAVALTVATAGLSTVALATGGTAVVMSAGAASAAGALLTVGGVAIGTAILAAAASKVASDNIVEYKRKTPGIRDRSSTRKEAKEKAFRRGGKKPPRGPEIHDDGKGPHYHPYDPNSHDHYYFPEHLFKIFTIIGIQYV